MAKTWGVRPSGLLGLTPDSLEAYCLDEAVSYFGNWVQHQLNNVKGKTDKAREGARLLVFRRIFGAELSGGTKFADPQTLKDKEVKIADV